MEINIKEIVIDLGGKELRLSLDEAKKLSEHLDSLFNKNQTVINIPYYRYPDRWWMNPFVTYLSTDTNTIHDNGSTTYTIT